MSILTTNPINTTPTIFEHPSFGKVRVITNTETGQPWFVARDVAEALGYSNPRHAVIEHCKGGRKMRLPTSGGTQEITIIPRGDVYRLITRSKLPSAERFESWVFDEVLPAIHDHGGYLTPSKVEEALLNPDTLIELANILKVERAAREKAQASLAGAQAQLAEAAPKAQLVDATFAEDRRGLLKLSEVVRKLDGVNTTAIKRDLLAEGCLYKTKAQYRVYAKYRDSHFIEKFNTYSGRQDIFATSKGAALIATLYYEGKLTMKAGF